MTNYSGFVPTESEHGFSKNVSEGSVSTASLLYRTNADEAAVTVSQRVEPDTNTASGTGPIPWEDIHAQSVNTYQRLKMYL